MRNKLPLLEKFSDYVQPVPRSAVFQLEGHRVWGHTMTRTEDGVYHMYFSYHPLHLKHENSRIGYATSKSATGPYTFHDVALPHGKTWDSTFTHSEHIMQYEDEFFLFYVGAAGDIHHGKWTGVAVADNPAGPWKRFDHPVIDNTIGDPANPRAASNPSTIIGPDGKIRLFYSCRGNGTEVHAAVADHPLGPYKFVPTTPIGKFGDMDVRLKVEDGTVWQQGDRYYFLCKDQSGKVNGTFIENTMVIHESQDLLDWTLCSHPTVLPEPRTIFWEDGEKETFYKLERCQIWWDEDGRKGVLCLVGMNGDKGTGTGNNGAANLQVPLRRPSFS